MEVDGDGAAAAGGEGAEQDAAEAKRAAAEAAERGPGAAAFQAFMPRHVESVGRRAPREGGVNHGDHARGGALRPAAPAARQPCSTPHAPAVPRTWARSWA